jgi:ligand-binding sensor domain-containing protein
MILAIARLSMSPRNWDDRTAEPGRSNLTAVGNRRRPTPCPVRAVRWRVLRDLGVTLVCLSLLRPAPAFGTFQTFDRGDGLANDWVTTILEDRAGNLWFGSWFRGLSRYDGAHWTTFASADGLANNYVSAILEDRAGNLWFALDPGVSRYDGTRWTNFTVADGLPDAAVETALEDRAGVLWFGTWGGGVLRYDGTRWTTYTQADGLAEDYVAAMMEDRAGNLWFGTSRGGVSRFDGTRWTTYTQADGLASNSVSAMLQDRDGNLWFGTYRDGVSRFDGARWATYTQADGLAESDVQAITQDRAGNLWFGTGAGASRYDGAHWTTYTRADGLVNDNVTAIREDRAGNLWLGTSAGLSRYAGPQCKTYTRADGLVHDVVLSILEDRTGDLWFGTNGGGVSRYDGARWTTYTRAEGTAGDFVNAILQDRAGNLWFGTLGGLYRFDGTQWTTFTVADGLASDEVASIAEDGVGQLWFATDRGVSRYDGLNWRAFTVADGLAHNTVSATLKDRAGNLWFGTWGGGVSRYDGVNWRSFTVADGLAYNSVSSILEDRAGNLWFGTARGVSRYDGNHWTTYTEADGLAGSSVRAILEDRDGILWFGTRGEGLSRFDGVHWTTFAKADGLPNDLVNAMLEERSGDFWIGTDLGVIRYTPDRVAPLSLIRNRPPTLLAGRTLALDFEAAYDESHAVFSSCIDQGPWSAWSEINSVRFTDLADTVHIFRVRARDRFFNVEERPAGVTFEIDATPPAPVLSSPPFGAVVRDSLRIEGTADDVRFRQYRLECQPLGSLSWHTLLDSTIPVRTGILATWDTHSVPDGTCQLRLSVTDSLGLAGVYSVSVIVDNNAPDVDVTSGATVTREKGGDIYSQNGTAHLYFPPHALARDAAVAVDTLREADLPSQPDGVGRYELGYSLGWGNVKLDNAAVLELALPVPGGDAGVPRHSAIYVLPAGSGWQRIGGTIEGTKIRAPVQEGGRYGIFFENAVPSGAATLTELSTTPRVFSPSGGYATEQVSIGFALGRAGPVTVRIYNRAGRLVREVAVSEAMKAGANLVRWDGRDPEGRAVGDGLYLVSIEAFGKRQTTTLAVVR